MGTGDPLPLTYFLPNISQPDLVIERIDKVYSEGICRPQPPGERVVLDKALHPVLMGKERTMIKTIFEERGDIGSVEGKIEAVLTVLRTRFHRIPKDVEKAVHQMTDLIALDSWTAQAATCQSMSEFAEALR